MQISKRPNQRSTVPSSRSQPAKAAREKVQRVFEQLRQYECRNVTFIEPDGSWPIVWERANGVHVWDAAGKKYLDLTAAFGVAAAGHANPQVIKAAQLQMPQLLHAMGDVHPHALKARLARELSRITFESWSNSKLTGKTIFCSSGFEAVEAALKTAVLATGKRGVIAFEGAYHGLGYGALNVTHREYFRSPFQSQLGAFGHFVPFPSQHSQLKSLKRAIEALFRTTSVGAILVEPIQARGGIHVPPDESLPMLRRLCDQHKVILILDEIYTGLGRTGRLFACEHTKTVPDIICLGKALTGGFPLSACVGRAEVMDAWPPSPGEAMHTSTFLGHPVGCAMALAQIREVQRRRGGQGDLVQRSAKLEEYFLAALKSIQAPTGLRLSVRGRGLMVGLEFCLADGSPATSIALQVVKKMLHRGFILLPEGEHANVIGFTPPLTITRPQVAKMIAELRQVIGECAPQ